MELKNKRNTKEFEEWFLRYVPAEQKNRPKQSRISAIKTRKLAKQATQLIKQPDENHESVEKTVKKVIKETRRNNRKRKRKIKQHAKSF